MRKLLASTTTYWLKDDHDHRFNDSDQTGEKLPGHELGRKIFREQVPIVALDDDESPTWRTVRVSKDLQIWMTEGRDHRSPNSMPDGPEKTMWGIEQRDWLKRTLLESDAFFKVLVSPTPLVGPDDGYKSDNHTNPKGFLTEGEAFHAWLTEHKLNDAGFVVICGDRHWQYHSVHPQGTHEFAVGALIDANARLGRKPGDPKSTDPEALVKQLYSSKKPSGGFLEVRIATEPTLRMELIFRDERGIELYRAQRNP
jgi:alkaline phosphatase/alkaline phosphatase D